jgi:hypothetical protein
MMKLLYMMKSIPMNFGIEGMLILTIKHYLSLRKWFKEYQKYNLHMKEFVEDVHLVKMLRSHSQVAIIDLRKS